jgi:NTP pyrophosphatase (non-canonical NTP hydrolase)
MTQELVDIMALAIINADLYDIDLEKALREKWIDKTGT